MASLFSKAFSGDLSLGNVVELGVGAKSLYDLFTDEDVPSAVKGAAGDTRAIARALQNPDDPMFKRLVEQESGTIAHDYAKALRDVGVSNRRMMAKTGGLGILDPERRDEALAGAYAKSFSDRKMQARAQAREYLSGALTANRAVAGAYAPQLAADQRDRERQASGMQMLLDLTQDRPSSNVSVNVSSPFNFRGTDPFNVPGLSFTGPTTYTTPGSI